MRRWRVFWAKIALLGAILVNGAAAATLSDWAGFEVKDARTRVVDGVYLLDAEIDFDFSAETVRAMQSGVSLTIIIDIQVARERQALWDEPVADLQARYQIETHALSKRYVLRNLNTGESRTFRSLDAMVAALGKVSSFPMLDSYLIDDDAKYRLWIRARVDIEELPSPLRPLAYLSSLWHVNSEWYAWPIER